MERTCVLQFVKDFSTAGLKLIEVDEELLKAIEQDNGSVCLKGAPDDEAVLCSATTTYSLKQLESTNTMLMIPEKQLLQSGTSEIRGQTASHYELLVTAPRLGKLKQILSKGFYKGPKDDKREETYTFTELSRMIQASDGEIRKGLQELHAVEIDGRWRLIDPDYISEVLEWLFVHALENNWSLKEISYAKTLAAMKQPDPIVLQNVLSTYGVRAATATPSTDSIWAIDLKKLAVYYALRLLTQSQSTSGFPLQEFLESWANCLPEGFTPSVDLLKGIAITESVGNIPYIRHFPASALPLNPRARLQELFRVRAKWTLDDIKPYIIDVVEPGSTVDALLVKNTRMVAGPNNTKLYCSRE